MSKITPGDLADSGGSAASGAPGSVPRGASTPPGPPPRAALHAAQAFARAGFGLWLVGGWVRDAVLGNIHTDLDFATDARPEQTFKVLQEWSGSEPWTTGIEFGTIGAQRGGIRVEVTTFRSEVYQAGSRNPKVTFAGDLETDLSRRDFTVNAMAITLPEAVLVDPFGGLDDLTRRRLRTPLSPEISFSDDPLRMLRAFRFVSTLGFEVDPAVLAAVSQMHDRLSIISSERIRDEFTKLMLGAGASVALDLVTSASLAREFLPELPDLMLEQDPIQRHKDVFRHTLAVLDNVCVLDADDPDLALRLAALLHDIGKPKTRQITAKAVSFHHHEVVGATMVENRLRELRYPARLVAEVREIVYLHHRFHTFQMGWTDTAVRRYVRDAGGLLGKLNMLVRADCTTRNPNKARQLAERMDELEARIRELASKEELARMRPALDGNEVMQRLGVGPGRVIGEALDFLMEIRLNEGEIDKDDALARLDEWYKGRNG